MGTAFPGERVVVTYLRLALTSALGGDDDDTVGSLGAVESSSRGILEVVETLDVLRVESGDSVTDTVDVIGVVEVLCRDGHGVVDHDTVHYPQRLAVADD